MQHGEIYFIKGRQSIYSQQELDQWLMLAISERNTERRSEKGNLLCKDRFSSVILIIQNSNFPH